MGLDKVCKTTETVDSNELGNHKRQKIGYTLTLGLTVKNYGNSAFGDSELAKFDKIFEKFALKGCGSTLNVLIVCAYSSESMRGFKAHTYAKRHWPTRFKHINEVLELNLTTPEMRAEFLGLVGETKLMETVQEIIVKRNGS